MTDNKTLLLFLTANTHKLTTGQKFGSACPNVPVSFGWDLVLEETSANKHDDDDKDSAKDSGAVTGRSLASGWNFLACLEPGSPEAGECSEKIQTSVAQQGVAPGVAFDACLAAISDALAVPDHPASIAAVVAHNTEFVLSVLRKFPDHPLVALLENPDKPIRRLCLCWDRRVRAPGTSKPVRFVELLGRYGLEDGNSNANYMTDQLRLTVRLYLGMRNDGTLGAVRDMQHDSDPRTPLVYLNVPFAEKEEAKKLGAAFDPAKRKWFVSVERADVLSNPDLPATWLQSGTPKRKRDEAEAASDE